MDTTSSDNKVQGAPPLVKKELVATDKVVKCARFRLPMFVALEKCMQCDKHAGLVQVQPALNGLPEVFDILCALPIHRRVEYVIVSAEEELNGTPE